MRESDFRDADALLIRLKFLARPNRQAALILDRVKLYLANQFDRGTIPTYCPRNLRSQGQRHSGSFHAKETPGR